MTALATAHVWRWLRDRIVWALAAVVLLGLLYQVPARHSVRVGLNDAAYVQGFNDPVNRWGVVEPESGATQPLRWSRDRSYLVFPQIGLPATASVRWRALPGDTGALPNVQVLLNGRDNLGSFPATGAWETHTFSIQGGWLKANDVFLELRVAPATTVDGELRGVEVDAADLATAGWPILPYPAQLVYGAVAAALATALVRGRRRQLSVVLLLGAAWLLLYRLGWWPYPLRGLLPLLGLALAALLGVRALPALRQWDRRGLWLAASVGVTLFFCGWLLAAQQTHTALSVPGVERDFPVFATRGTALTCPASAQRATAPCVLRADGFYQLGYPALLWLGRALGAGDAFATAKVVAVLSAGLLALATAALGWRLAPAGQRGPVALLAVLVLVLSPLTVQYGLYVGTDMPFAAAWALGLAALLAPGRHRPLTLLFAGGLCAAAFVIRHPGLVLLPFGWLALVLLGADRVQLRPWRRQLPWRALGWLTLGWLVVALPQLAVNLADTGAPLYSQQAKNIWLAVYGNTDYSGQWRRATDDVALRELVLADPGRFFANWGRNLVAFVGTGAEDTREFGVALGLRLLHAPASWLALLGLGWWAWRGDRRVRLVVLGAALYVVGVSVGFVLPRFFLPLVPIWAVAASAALAALARALAQRWPRLTAGQWLAAAAILVLGWMLDGPRVGARYVLERQQPVSAVPLSDRSMAALPAGRGHPTTR